MENTEIMVAREKKDKLKFHFRIFGIALLVIGLILIDFFFADIINYAFKVFPAFESYYRSISDVDKISIINMIYSTVSMGVPALVGMLLFLQKPWQMVPMKKVSGQAFTALVFFGICFSRIANTATAIISGYVTSLGYSTEYMEEPAMETPMEMFFRVIMIAVFPAIFEELLFRGAILQGLRKFSSDTFAIFFSAFLFGLVHGNIVQMPFAFLLGVYFAAVTVYTNSILPAMAIHFINNFMSAMMSVLSGIMPTVLVNILYILLIVVMMVIGIVQLAKLTSKDNNLFYVRPNQTTIPDKKMWLWSMLNIGTLACIGYFGYEIVTLMMK